MIADSVFDYFRDERHISDIARLKAAGLQFSSVKEASSSEALAGKTIVVSGNFSISRDEVKRLIEANGGKNSSSVSSKTSYLLAGTKPGPEKIKKAAELGISVISEEEFMQMLPAGISASDSPAAGQTDVEPTLF